MRITCNPSSICGNSEGKFVFGELPVLRDVTLKKTETMLNADTLLVSNGVFHSVPLSGSAGGKNASAVFVRIIILASVYIE